MVRININKVLCYVMLCYVSAAYLLLTIFPFFFLFSQKASNITSILLQNLRKELPDEVNLLVATYELESFAIKYAKTHLTAKKKATVRQDLFGGSGFVIFS